MLEGEKWLLRHLWASAEFGTKTDKKKELSDKAFQIFQLQNRRQGIQVDKTFNAFDVI